MDKCLLRPIVSVSHNSIVTIAMVTLTHYRHKRIIEDVYPMTSSRVNLTN